MTCGLHTKLDAAVVAVREALTAAIEADVSEKDLDNLVCAYKGLKSVAKANVTTGITFVPDTCLLYTSPSPRDKRQSRMPSSA